jgi:hypothetical protein
VANVFTQTIQAGEMTSDDNDGIRNPNGDDYSSDDDYVDDDDLHEHGDDDEDDDDDNSIESDSLCRSEIIIELPASFLQYLKLSDELWVTSVATESFQSDIENLIVALQSNRSLTTIIIYVDILAAIGVSD